MPTTLTRIKAGRARPANLLDNLPEETMRHGEYKMPGGKLVVVDLAVEDGHIGDVQVSGDFFLEPDSARARIDAALRGAPAGLDEAGFAARIEAALGTDVSMYGVSPTAIAVALCRARDAGDPA